jgi:hypothetical protein
MLNTIIDSLMRLGSVRHARTGQQLHVSGFEGNPTMIRHVFKLGGINRQWGGWGWGGWNRCGWGRGWGWGWGRWGWW